jgi:hypothetical protein
LNSRAAQMARTIRQDAHAKSQTSAGDCASALGWTARCPESFPRRAQPSHVLRIERAERSRDSRPDPNNAFVHAWPQQCNPKLAAKKELRTADGRRASCMRSTIKLHLFHRCRCVIHGKART